MMADVLSERVDRKKRAQSVIFVHVLTYNSRFYGWIILFCDIYCPVLREIGDQNL